MRARMKEITKELKRLGSEFRNIKKRAQAGVVKAKDNSKLKDLRARLSQIK